MDRTDVSLCLFLMTNSRTPYHELAARLGLSINAVHKRIGALVNLGIIRAFTAHPSLASLGAISVWVYGSSEAAHPGDLRLHLKEDDRTYWVANSGGGYVYVGGYLRDISELNEYVEFVKKESEMGNPTVGITPSMGRPSQRESLKPLDYQILASLRKDSRKPATDVAEEVNASAKTVHRRLEWMLEKGLVDFTIDWYPDASNDIVALCHVELARGFDRMKVLEALNGRFGQNILLWVLFSNLPNQIALFLWTNSMKQMEDLRESVAGAEGAGSVMLNVLQIGYMFDTWRDKLVLEKAGGSPKKGPHLSEK
jgi:DNA-binding Lrp family transcriptional regulator